VRAPSVQVALDVLAVLDLDLRDLERRALDVLDDRINRRPSSPS
jgi:hypothetical protein